MNRTVTDLIFRFIRRGVAGGYRDEMPEEFIRRFNDWMDEDISSGWDS